MAAHGAGHSACQLHCASLIHIAQGPEHLQKRGRVGEPAVSLSFPNLTPPSCSLPLRAGGTRGAATVTGRTGGSAASPFPSESAFAPAASRTEKSHSCDGYPLTLIAEVIGLREEELPGQETGDCAHTEPHGSDPPAFWPGARLLLLLHP